MKPSRLILVVLVLLFVPGLVFAGGSSTACKTKYPVVLAHGMGASAEILGIVDYWWGIEGALEGEGARVYITSVNGMDSTENKAADWKRQVLNILAASRSAKVNVIGHSHGTIYTRCAITNMGLASKVASHTSLAGPHLGSSVADVIMYMPDKLVGVGTNVLDFIYAFVFGDTNPDTYTNVLQLTTGYMKNVFNPNTPNVSGIYYQSWAAKAKWSCPSVVLEPTWILMLAMEGDNDGLVGVNSAKWGNFRGVQQAAWYSAGCDHLNMVGQLFGMTPGFSAPDFFVSVVKDLKNRGY
ncbi:MAG: alpha/beta fold hydrolase [Proteobacteria bacterium]|nr:alpha/beta fold hydrolase [Pseudomonadota bacterium]